MSKAQLEQAAAQEAFQAKMDQERALQIEFGQLLEAQKELDKKLRKPQSIYVTPYSSPA